LGSFFLIFTFALGFKLIYIFFNDPVALQSNPVVTKKTLKKVKVPVERVLLTLARRLSMKFFSCFPKQFICFNANIFYLVLFWRAFLKRFSFLGIEKVVPFPL